MIILPSSKPTKVSVYCVSRYYNRFGFIIQERKTKEKGPIKAPFIEHHPD